MSDYSLADFGRPKTDEALAALARIWWRMKNPDATPEEWTVLHFLAVSLGRGRCC